VKTEIDLQGYDQDGRLDAELESTVYRVVQEALTNVGKHAEANSAIVQVQANNGLMRVQITDDGRGLPADVEQRAGERVEQGVGGFGMSGMRERAELVGGEMDVRPADPVTGKGTIVRLTIPLSGRPLAAATQT